MNASDLPELILGAMDNVHDMDVEMPDYARAVAARLDACGLLALEPLRDRLAEIAAVATRLRSPSPEMTNISFRPLMPADRRWSALIFQDGWRALIGHGASPEAAMDDLEARIVDPAALEAAGWATLGVERA